MEKPTIMPPFQEIDRGASYARFRMLFEPHAITSVGDFEASKKRIVSEGEKVFVSGQNNIVYLEDIGNFPEKQLLFDECYLRSKNALKSFGAQQLLIDNIDLAAQLQNPLQSALNGSEQYLRLILNDNPNPELLYRLAQLIAIDRLNKRNFDVQIQIENTGFTEEYYESSASQRSQFATVMDYKKKRLQTLDFLKRRDEKIVQDFAGIWSKSQVNKNPTNVLFMMGSSHHQIAEQTTGFGALQAYVDVRETQEFLRNEWKLMNGDDLPLDTWEKDWMEWESAMKDEGVLVEKLRKSSDKFIFS